MIFRHFVERQPHDDTMQTERLGRIVCTMSPMVMQQPFGDSSTFIIQQHGHRDMVQAADFNRYGNRFAIGSADGRIKVYDRHRDGSWALCDTWGAHSGEIIEVQGLAYIFLS
jgi:nucleoporin SEH1